MGGVTQVMGIVNVTPDSFSDGGEFLTADAAIAHGRDLLAAGADIVDIGGESTRPGAAEVPAEEETERVIPVVEALAGDGATVSIDTSKAAVAEAALAAGAAIVNDVTALSDPAMAPLCAERGPGVILMHMRGTPRTMQDDPVYDDVVTEVREFLAERMRIAVEAGIAEERIWVDPGIGFGKTVDHNLELIARLGEIGDLGRPIVFGASRKTFIGRITGREVDDRLGGSVASNVLGLAQGADVLRVHDVAETIQAVRVAERILGGGSVSPEPQPVRVELVGLEAFGAHGVSDAEREVGRRIVLDISFIVPDSHAVAADDLEGTVDYGVVATLAASVVTGTSCRTLEHLCGLVADEIEDRFPEIRDLEIRAAKTEPPIPEAIGEVAVTLRRKPTA